MAFVLTSVDEVPDLDPRQPAPPLVVDNVPGRDSLYHHAEGGRPERMLPLIGNSAPARWFPRPYTLDVAFDGRRRRVYADSARDVLCVLLGGEYAALAAAADDAAERYNTLASDPETPAGIVDGARDAVFTADAAAFAARARHATEVRTGLQRQLIAAARDSGALAGLDSLDAQVLQAAGDPNEPAPGCWPDNHSLSAALYEVPVWSADGSWRTLDRLLWDPPIRLVLNTADYSPYGDSLPPESIAAHDMPGRDIPLADPGEPNLLWLRPETEDGYLWSLHNAAVVSVDLYPVDLPDPLFRDAFAELNSH